MGLPGLDGACRTRCKDSYFWWLLEVMDWPYGEVIGKRDGDGGSGTTHGNSFWLSAPGL